jgi:uncharacterized protein (TIGR03086 family)
MTTNLDRYVSALQGLDGVVQQVHDEHLDSVTPCPPWTVRHLLGHVIDGQRQVLAMLRGHGPRRPQQGLVELARAAGTAPTVLWGHEHAQTLDTLSRVDLEGIVATPGNTMRIDDLLSTATIEPLLHAWDLATAIGTPVELDADAVHATLGLVRELGDQLAATGMFAPARPWTDSMTPLEQLLAFTGRTPPPRSAHQLPPRASDRHAARGGA